MSLYVQDLLNEYNELFHADKLKEAAVVRSKMIRTIYFETPNPLENPYLWASLISEYTDFKRRKSNYSINDWVRYLERDPLGHSEESSISHLILRKFELEKKKILDTTKKQFMNGQFKEMSSEVTILERKIMSFLYKYYCLEKVFVVNDADRIAILLSNQYPLQGVIYSYKQDKNLSKEEDFIERDFVKLLSETDHPDYQEKCKDMINYLFAFFILNLQLQNELAAKYFLIKIGQIITEEHRFYWYYRFFEKEILIDETLNIKTYLQEAE